MDLVTITDHDSIDGCLEFLDRHPDAADFFISEEIECWFPGVPLKLHIGAYGIDERIHAEVRRLRSNVYDVASYLRQQHVCFALNHTFFFFQRQVSLHEYLRAVLPLCPAFEVRNGAMLRQQNVLVRTLVRERRRAGLVPPASFAGSDAHTLRAIGTTYTEAPGRTREEFLDSLRAGRTRVRGRHGGVVRITTEIYGVIWQYWRSLAGFGRQEFSWGRRAVGLGWSLASLPAEFVPLLVAIVQKSGEARRLAAFRRELLASPPAFHATAVENHS
jgi:predicted metal-dependent phosphoesterase TrpH